MASSSKLYQYLQRNPHEQSYRQVIELPEDTRLEDWLAIVIIEIFDNLTSIYSSLSHCCNDTSCPRMNIGLSHEYLWHEFQDTNSSIKHKKIYCSAPKYIHSFINFIQETISNSAIFPTQSNNEYPPTIHFHSLIQYICKQIFRVFGHLYLHHLPSITALGLHLTMNTCFKHYLYFVEEFELIKPTELKPLERFIQISLGRLFGKKHQHKPSDYDISAPSNDPNITAFSSIEHSSPNISSLSLPKSPDHIQQRPLIKTARKSETLPQNKKEIKENASLDIAVDYKYNDQPSSSVSILSSMNSITPYPTYDDQDGEPQSQSKINQTLNNRSVYEFIFNRSDINDSRSSHVAIPHEIRNEEEEKASMEYNTNDIESAKTKANIDKSVLRKCKIIRPINAKNTPSTEAIQRILSGKSIQRIPLLSSSDLGNIGDINDEENKHNIRPDTAITASPSFRDVVYYRSKVRKLQSEVKELRDQNRELLGPKTKKKKKKRPKTNMSKLVDIMNSMNEQITKLAEAVNCAVTSTDEDDDKMDSDHKVDSDHVEENDDDDDDEILNTHVQQYLRKGLREDLLGKVSNDEEN